MTIITSGEAERMHEALNAIGSLAASKAGGSLCDSDIIEVIRRHVRQGLGCPSAATIRETVLRDGRHVSDNIRTRLPTSSASREELLELAWWQHLRLRQVEDGLVLLPVELEEMRTSQFGRSA